jgi:hypothetical protein
MQGQAEAVAAATQKRKRITKCKPIHNYITIIGEPVQVKFNLTFENLPSMLQLMVPCH